MQLPACHLISTWFVIAGCGPVAASTQLVVLPHREPQQVFTGEARAISVVWQNAGDEATEAELRTRLFQATSATAVQLGEAPWKRLEVLPGQTVIESATLAFPAVKAETRFLVQWLAGTNTVLGTTDVLVYPTNLLAELQTLAGAEPVGVFDPDNQLKPLLKALAVDMLDLENSGIEDFAGNLAIFGPFKSKAQVRRDLARQIESLARKGAGVVWLQPPPEIKPPPARRESPQPSFYTVPFGKGAVVVVQADMVAQLATSPQAQLNLIHFARLARNPAAPALPDLTQEHGWGRPVPGSHTHTL